MRPRDVIVLFVLVRLSTVFIVQTWFVPDEFYQTVEVAHKIVFGYGYVTWEWEKGVRSYVYPALLSSILFVLRVLGLDSVNAVIYAPRVLQAIISAVSDYFFWKWYCTQNGGRGYWAIFCILNNSFWLYCGSRTLINAFEAALTTIALSLFPWDRVRNSTSFLWFAGIACMIRPTAIIIWVPICIYHLVTSYDKKTIILQKYIPIGLIVAGCGFLIDSYFYGRFIFTPLEFFRVNILHNIGSFYGSHPFYWYIIGGIPAVLACHIVPVVLGAYKTVVEDRNSREKILVFVILGAILILSLVPHKEFRFLLPLVPMFIYIESKCLAHWSRKADIAWIWAVAIVLFASNLLILGYLGLVHQRGTMDVMKELPRKVTSKTELLFLMPCHSTPLYSHLHVDIPARFLTCEPDFTGNLEYKDEADLFYDDPEKWLKENFPNNATASHVILFDVLVPHIQGFLNRNNYKPTSKLFHKFYPSGKVGGYVQVFTRK